MRGRSAVTVAVAALVSGLVGACAPVPLARDVTFHASDADLGVTRVVHGSFVLELHATRLLVDPWFYSGYLTRQGEPLGLTPATLPQIAAVLVTSDAPDHFDARALHELATSVPRVIAPPALRQRLADLGFREVTGLPWWEHTEVNGIGITAVPASEGARANGYVVASHEVSIYLAGATGPVKGLVDVAIAFPHLDVAILPIGGLRRFGVLHEMTPEQAAEAAVTLGAARVVPSDYGAHSGAPWAWYAGDPLDRFRRAMTAHGIGDRVTVLESGESWHYTKP